MLFNPKTNIKNLVSNALLRPITKASGATSAVIQQAYSYFDKDFKPTQAWQVKLETKQEAGKVWAAVKDTFESNNKYYDKIKGFRPDTVVFKSGAATDFINSINPNILHKLNEKMGKEDVGAMETLRNATYWLLEMCDNKYVQKNFVDRLGSYMQAQNIKKAEDVPQEAINVAYKEALSITLQTLPSTLWHTASLQMPRKTKQKKARPSQAARKRMASTDWWNLASQGAGRKNCTKL